MLWTGILTAGKLVLNWFGGSNLDRILTSVDKRFDNETQREEIKADVKKTWISAQTQLLLTRTWWFQLFFIVPLGAWFSWVTIYSMFLCRNCVYAQEWDVAALPEPLNEWAGWIIMSLFIVDQAPKAASRVKAFF